MRDPGIQNAGVNHRRWLLYPQTRFVGLGDIPQVDKRLAASGFSAYDGLYAGNRPPVRDEFVAWPPPGWVPYALVFARWSLSLPDADFSAAKVSLSLDGVSIPLLQEVNERGAGEPTLVWRPINLAAEAAWPQPRGDSHYRVEIGGISQAGRPRQIAYEVHVFDPAQDGPAGPQEARVQGLARIPVEGGAFTISLPTGATGAQWRALKLADFPLDEGAEAGYGAFSYSGSNDYPVLQQRVLASGKQAFRLAHNHIGDEMLTLVGQLAPGPRASLRFKQRLGIAGTGEEARVEARVVGSDAWEALYQRRANGQTANADKQFSEQRVDLGDYAGKLIELRFRYQFAQGDFYPPDDDRVGWYLDDIRLEQTSRVLFAGEPLRSGGNGFRFLPEQKGEWRLQARPTVYSAPGDWGPLWPVTVE
ncbi:hypothetical protein [Chitinimonas naiadis]